MKSEDRQKTRRPRRKKDREAGLIERGTPMGPAEQSEWLGDDVAPAPGEIEPGAAPAQ